jgi:hypothetical protein
LNLRNRFLETLKGRKADRVPLMLDGFLFTSRAKIDADRDPARREIAHRVFDYCASFVLYPSYVNRYLVTPAQFTGEVSRQEQNGNTTVTSEIATPKGKLTAITAQNSLTRTIWTVKYPVESLQDIEKIRSVRWELPLNLAPPDLSQLPSNFYEKGILRTGVSSPFVCVAGMMPYQYFLELSAIELNLLKELTLVCKERILNVLDVLLTPRTIDYVWMGGCEWVTPPMGSPRLYDELVQESEKEVISRIHDAGALCHIHCHGNVRSTLEMVIERGGDFFEPVEPPPDGDITFAEAKEVAAGRITLGGNIEARILANESADVVEEATRKAFEGGKHRMVLKTSDGPISKITPSMLKNYHRLIDVWEELSCL